MTRSGRLPPESTCDSGPMSPRTARRGRWHLWSRAALGAAAALATGVLAVTLPRTWVLAALSVLVVTAGAALRRRYQGTQVVSDFERRAVFAALVLGPTLLGMAPLSRWFWVAIAVAGVASLLVALRSTRQLPVVPLALSLPLALTLATEDRYFAWVGSLGWLAVLTAALLLARGAPQLLHLVFMSALVFVAANTAGWVLGITPPTLEYLARIPESSWNLFPERIYFPFAPTWSDVAFVSAALLVGTALYLRWAGWSASTTRARTVLLGAVALSAFAMLASDGRWAVLVGLALVLLGGVSPGALLRLATPVVLLFFAFPFVWLATNGAFAGLVSWLSGVGIVPLRRTDEVFSAVGGRVVIWESASDVLSTATPVQFLMGWGVPGHVNSGLFLSVEANTVYRDPTAMSAHSAAVQLWLDAGILGVVIFGVLVTRTAVQLSRWRSEDSTLAIAATGGLLALSASFATEAVALAPRSVWVFIIALAFAAEAQRASDREGLRAPRTRRVPGVRCQR